MTSTVLFLQHLRAIGVRLSLTDGKLHIQAPPGTLNPDIRTQLEERGNEVAQFLREQSETLDRLPPITSHDAAEAPLSYNQQHIWHKHRISHNAGRFNNATVIKLIGTIDVERLEEALNRVIARHSALRTVLLERQGEPHQYEQFDLNVPILYEDMRSIAPAHRDGLLQRRLRQQTSQPFNLVKGPLLRAAIFQTSDDANTLLLVTHQMIFDERSQTIMLSEWADFYNENEVRVSQSAESLEPVEYSDYAIWQRWPGVFDRQMAYWREELAEAPPLCKLPTDWPRPKLQGDRGGRELLLLDSELQSGLINLSQQMGMTLSMTILAGFKLLLSRMSGSEDVLIGTTLPSRTQVEVADVVGYFSNTVLLRTDLSDGPTFTQLLRRVARAMLDAQDNQDLPFARMLEALRAEKKLRHDSLLQICYNMKTLMTEPLPLDGVESRQGQLQEPTVLYDLTLNVEEREDGIWLEALYRSELFRPNRIALMLKQLEFVLMQAVVATNRPIATFSLNPNPQKLDVRDVKDFSLLTELVTRQAHLNATKIAVSDETVSIPYGDLARRINQIANYLVESSLQPGDRVAVVAARCVALAPVMLGVMRAGMTLVLLNPSDPTSRIAEQIGETNPSAVIVLEDAEPLPVMLSQCLAQVGMRIDYSLDMGLPAKDEQPPVVDIRPDNVAWLTFSNEMVERLPIVVTHRVLAHYFDWQNKRFELHADEHFALLAGLADDAVMRDVITPLVVGASLHVPPRTVPMKSAEFCDWLAEKQITTLNLTPKQCEVVVDQLAFRKDPLSLRTVFIAGHLDELFIRSLRATLPGAALVTLYGAPETALAAGYNVVPQDGLLMPGDDIPLGQGIDGVDLLVLNEHGQLAGVGELGEIFVRTPYQAMGYYGRPELTARHFVVSRRFGRMWQTRDFGRIRPDGMIEYVVP